ncbi:MAG: 3-mercaptopyruvate sulfurtransferase SseA [Verrucomicrobiales bacterium]|jgi:3-mercaptopyruvate sulfurtransferase SseA
MNYILLVSACLVAFLFSHSFAGPLELSTGEIKLLLDSPDADTVLVDTRSSGAYLGWSLEGIERGGHLPSAVHFAADWLQVDRPDRDEVLRAALVAKGIKSEHKIILCDETGKDRRAVATWLRERGFDNLHFFDLDAWASDPALPLVSYPNHAWLVPPVIAKAILDGERPMIFESASTVKFAEVSWGKADVSYDKGHIPSSIHIDTNAIEPPPLWELASPEQLQAFALAHGITCHDTIILSGTEPMASFRVAVVLRYMGVRDVRVLHGGDAAWTTAGYALETVAHQPVPAKSFGCKIPARPRLIDSCEGIKLRLHKDQRFTLVDIRTWEEHIGKVSGYSYHKEKGRIPGAIFGHAGTHGPLSLDHYRNIDGTMRSPSEIVSLWRTSGIDPDTHLSFMCGGGWRAAEVLTYAQVMGLKKVSLYSEGWLGWSRDSSNPVATGKPTAVLKLK